MKNPVEDPVTAKRRRESLTDAKKSRAFLGRDLLIKHLEKRKLTPVEAIKAKCNDCCGNFYDGRWDCKDVLCPIYPWMPYKDMGESSTVD